MCRWSGIQGLSVSGFGIFEMLQVASPVIVALNRTVAKFDKSETLNPKLVQCSAVSVSEPQPGTMAKRP